MAQRHRLQRTVFVAPDYFRLLQRAWIVAEHDDRRHFLAALMPALPFEELECAARLSEEEARWHWRYQMQDADASSPLTILHLVWRQVSPEDRRRFLMEMTTPAERRALASGLDDEETIP